MTDEDPERTNEEKSAVWKKFDSNGYYRTGVYTNEKYLFAGSRSSYLYCLDKITGETIQKIALSSESGAISTAICYENGRIYFATENGYLFSYRISESGTLDSGSGTSMKLGGAVFGTPLVHNNRIYVGSASKDKYGVVQVPIISMWCKWMAPEDFLWPYQMETVNGIKARGL